MKKSKKNKSIEILKNRKAFERVQYLKNHTAHEATEAHNYVCRRLGEIQRDLSKNV
jgi:hypothetical protein